MYQNKRSMKEQLSSTELESINGGIIIIISEVEGNIIILDETEEGRAVRSSAARR